MLLREYFWRLQHHNLGKIYEIALLKSHEILNTKKLLKFKTLF